MGWLRLVGSIKLYVSFAKEPYERDDILQKRPIILSILLTVATPYECHPQQFPACCCVLQCVTGCCSVMQCVAMRCSVLQCVAVFFSVFQCVSVCCSVLQCVAVCCSVLRCAIA